MRGTGATPVALQAEPAQPRGLRVGRQPIHAGPRKAAQPLNIGTPRRRFISTPRSAHSHAPGPGRGPHRRGRGGGREGRHALRAAGGEAYVRRGHEAPRAARAHAVQPAIDLRHHLHLPRAPSQGQLSPPAILLIKLFFVNI